MFNYLEPAGLARLPVLYGDLTHCVVLALKRSLVLVLPVHGSTEECFTRKAPMAAVVYMPK